MKRISASTQVPATQGDVWALMCDVERYPEWVNPTDRVVEAAPGPLGVGYVYREYGGIPPFKGEFDWTITEFEPMRWQRHVGSDGFMTVHVLILIEPHGQDTAITMGFEMRSRWFIAPLNALLWPIMMRRRSQRALQRTVEAVKPALERVITPGPTVDG